MLCAGDLDGGIDSCQVYIALFTKANHFDMGDLPNVRPFVTYGIYY